ncbi:hypothetical protein Athai_59450 [Actinocatenispora thailandica]|uniref:YihY/virulence factor BrkB family protein n=1 Tax=Actinocatenispora thailandica TaxID=227318 RepID=A0A7R7DV63_9ACTN|nr:YihY/virulence factor BrkB family protein [Actinocatenispora thailandica]BCJ38442.1 hypothetical protein Athai_59450 [Actinocatenispora thailandica]
MIRRLSDAWSARLGLLLRQAWGRLLRLSGPRTRRALVLVRRAVGEFAEDRCPQLAAAIAFHVLLSVFPLAIVVLSTFGLVADEAHVRDTVIGTVTAYVPLTADGQRGLAALLAQLQGGSAALGLLGLLGVVIAASGMMGALRTALTLAWDAPAPRGFLHGKLVDVLLVAATGPVLLASFVLTVVDRLTSRAGQSPEVLGRLVGAAGWLLGLLAPMALTFVVFVLLFRIVPATRTRVADVWPGALFGTVLFEALKDGFAVYLANFAHYNAIYGVLGAAAAFIFFVYLSANVLLLAAEVASEHAQRAPAARR